MARKNDDTPASNVLIIRFSALGDVCMTIPVVYAVCRANPGVRFIYLTKKPLLNLFIGTPANLTVVGADLKAQYAGFRGVVRLILDVVHRYNITMVADLHSVLRTHLMDMLCRLRGIRVATIDKQRHLRHALVSEGASKATPLRPMTERYVDVFLRLGLNAPELTASGPVIGNIPPGVASEYMQPKRPGTRWIAVAPFAAHNGKIYPEKLMCRVVEQLAAMPDTTVILFGGGAREEAVLNRWAAEIPSVVTLAGKRCGFRIELAIIAQCDVMVSMDSANMHMASLTDTPVVSIWGATHPAAGFFGWQQSRDNAVQAELSCRPCSVFGNKPCSRGDYECLASIPPRQIVDKVKAVINRNR